MDLRCWEIKIVVGLNTIRDYAYFVFVCVLLTCIGLLAKQREVT